MSLVGAIFKTNLTNYHTNPPFWIELCSNINQDWQCQRVCIIYYSYSYRAWFQKWIFVPYALRRKQPGDVTRT